jgi:hypothetical protein
MSRTEENHETLVTMPNIVVITLLRVRESRVTIVARRLAILIEVFVVSLRNSSKMLG